MIDWDIVKQAVEVAQVNDRAGELLLQQAMGDSAGSPTAPAAGGCSGGGCSGQCKPGCCGSTGSPTGGSGGETPVPEPTPDKAVIYGKDGYTDARDPRTPACRSHEFDGSGKPTAVHCAVLVQPTTRYRCVLLDLIPHDESCQVYVEVVGKDGSPQSKTNTRLLTGWSESPKYDALYDAPASPGNFAMGREAKFYPPALGACGAVVVDESGNIDSDIAGSMGISRGTHMSFRCVFRAR